MAHQHYKGTGQMHSFRGQLVDGGTAKIRIEGAVGAIAWRITKFEIMPSNFNITEEYSVTIKRNTFTPSVLFDFSSDETLAAAYFESTGGSSEAPTGAHVIFDNDLFNRNIFVGLACAATGGSTVNYYIELEEVKVSTAGMAQLAVATARRIGLNP